jgi:hypothetical protein
VLCTQFNNKLSLGSCVNNITLNLARDLEMMAVAGLSVAYYANPAVLEYADIVINYGGLDIMVDFFNKSFKAHMCLCCVIIG